MTRLTPAAATALGALVARAQSARSLEDRAAAAALAVLVENWTGDRAIHWNDIDRTINALRALQTEGVRAPTIGKPTPLGSTIPKGWSMIPDAYVVTAADHVRGDALAEEPSPSDLFEAQSSAFANAEMRGEHVYGVAAMASTRGPWLVVTPALR